MCFSPKIKTPQVNTSVVPEPAPLTEAPTGVQFGGTEDSNSVNPDVTKGRKSVTVKKTDSASKAIGSKAFNS